MTDLLHDRIALVTGSSRGIGQAAAWAMADAGADVIVHYHKFEEGALATARGVEERGRRVLIVQANLEDPEQIDRVFSRIGDAFGRLDIYMANAAATAFKPGLEMRPHHYQRTFSLIVESLLLTVQRVVPLMERSGRAGRILTVSGHGTTFTLPNYAGLGSAKGAVETWTRYWAYELGPKNITVNCLSPGVIDTDSARYYLQDRFARLEEAATRATPLRRLGRPEDVAQAAVLLASDAAGFITGQVLRVDGGISLTSGPFEEIQG
jgi:enoyl-[acyl-carrier protein] reductase III